MEKMNCVDCEEIREILPSIFKKPVCNICGAYLVPVLINNVSPVQTEQGASSILNDLFEIMGEELREAMEAAILQSSPSRQISTSYLNTLGKIIIDEKKTILYDAVLEVGPLKILAVPANFGFELQTNIAITKNLVYGNPLFGESEIVNVDECNNSIVVLKRGLVSFAKKTINVLNANASAVVITQTFDIWPFVMTDSIDEYNTLNNKSDNNLSNYNNSNNNNSNNNANNNCIPIVMISKTDAELIEKIIEKTTINKAVSNNNIITKNNNNNNNDYNNIKNNSSNNNNNINHFNNNNKISCNLKINNIATECSICQEFFVVGDEVCKLSCRHVYHTSCVLNWLQSHHTCPLCRLQLPSQDIQQQKQHSNLNLNSNNDNSQIYFN
jgi:hypothetical protein